MHPHLALFAIYRYEIAIVDISTLLTNINISIDIKKDNLEKIDININNAILENIDNPILLKDNLEDINIDIDKDYLENIDKGLFIYYVIQFGGLGRPPPM